MEEAIDTKYAILTRKTKLRIYNKDLLFEGTGDGINQICLEAGTTVQILHMKTNTTRNISKCVVKILDYVNNSVYEAPYECLLSNLQKVCESLWPYVISIIDPDERLKMVQNDDHCKWVMSVKNNTVVKVLGGMFSSPTISYICIVRYIGLIPELYPVGYFFGLEMMDLKNGHSPQMGKMPFALKYMSHPEMSIFTTANWIRPISGEQEKKLSAREFIAESIERVVSVIGPANVLGGGNITSLKTEKKLKQKESTAQFYDTINSGSVQDVEQRHVESQLFSFINETVPTVNDEQSVKRRTKQTQTQQTTGILKHKRSTSSTTKNGELPNMTSIAKSYGERDIVIINNTDISPDAEVIVLETSQIKANKFIVSDACGSSTRDYNSLRKDHTRNRASANSLSTSDYGAALRSSQELPPTTYDVLPTVLDNAIVQDSPLKEIPEKSLGIGSMVEVYASDISDPLYGVIRWIGVPPGKKEITVGVELDNDNSDKCLLTTDGSINGIPLFKCPNGRGLFVTSNQCVSDRRFLITDGGSVINPTTPNDHDIPYNNAQNFGQVECPIVPGAIAPLKCLSLDELEEFCGKFKGIQGHHNSCYLDVTLFSMFTFTPVFDAVLFRSPNFQDIPNYNEVQTVLREEIVNPLRKHVFVRADRVMKLRELLDKLSSVGGLTSEEKDPEEFLNCLLAQIMKSEPFLKLSSGQEAYYYQLFVEKDERLSFPSVQQLFEQSFYASDIKLKEVPSCLIIQMPRFGKNYKMYQRILPSQVLDITDILENSPRQCTICGNLAEFECRDCFNTLQSGSGLEYTAFCSECLQKIHNHDERVNHTSRKLPVSQDFSVMVKHMAVPRLYMELFAVVCIETSHYVTFVKTGSGPDAPWCFFDSMADRKGEQNGYNIPEIITVPDLPHWLSEDGARNVHETSPNDKLLPEHAKRLFCDAYMCMYQSTDVMMYR